MQRFFFKRLFFGLILLLATIGTSFAQNNDVRGFVYEASTGEPIMFSNVYLKGTTLGCSTNENGHFNITRIPDGSYTLLVTCLGYDTIRQKIALKGETTLNMKFYMEALSVNLDAVSVTADKVEARTETKTSVITVTPKTLSKIPSVGGQADLAQYLQVVPGVIFTGDQGGQLYIRGGSPIMNKVLLDGMVVYNPFHSIGLFSVFDTDIIRNAEVYTGGFGAEHGGRISSVMDISTRDGNKKHMSGKFGASTFGAKLMIEGPLKKANTPDEASISFILSGKMSYLEQTSKVLYSYASEDGLPFNYQDIYGKVSINASNGSKVNLFGFSFNDQVNNYKSLANFGWDSYGAGGNFLVIPGKAPVMIEGNIAYSSYTARMKEANNPDRYSKINGFNVGINSSYFLGKNTLKFGFEILGFTTDYLTYSNIGNHKIEEKENTTEMGFYVKYKATFDKFLFEPSFRIHCYASLPDISPEPRIAMKYNISDSFRLKAAAGYYTQNFVAATSDRDVVNLFYGFLSDVKDLPTYYDGKPVNSHLQKAFHYIAGMELDLGRNITSNFELYYKDFNQLTNINRSKMYEDDAENATVPDLLKKDFMIEKGNAYGFDVSLKYEDKNWYVWAVYALGFVNREYEKALENGTIISANYAPHFDRRHNVNLLVTYTAGAKRQWEFSGRWNFGSGFPFTQVQGYYENLSFMDGIYFDYITANGELGLLYGELNQGRLPCYHRLDIDAKRRFYFSERCQLEVNLGVTNVYNRANVFYVDVITSDVTYQLPIMPTLGFTMSF